MTDTRADADPSDTPPRRGPARRPGPGARAGDVRLGMRSALLARRRLAALRGSASPAGRSVRRRPRLVVDDLPARARPLPDRQVGRHEGHRVLHRLRPPHLVVPAGRDRVRPQGHPRRRLREDHRHEQPRGGRSRRRGPHLPPEVVPASACSWPSAGSAMHFLIAFVLSSSIAADGIGLPGGTLDRRRRSRRWRVGTGRVAGSAGRSGAGLRGRRPDRRRRRRAGRRRSTTSRDRRRRRRTPGDDGPLDVVPRAADGRSTLTAELRARPDASGGNVGAAGPRRRRPRRRRSETARPRSTASRQRTRSSSVAVRRRCRRRAWAAVRLSRVGPRATSPPAWSTPRQTTPSGDRARRAVSDGRSVTGGRRLRARRTAALIRRSSGVVRIGGAGRASDGFADCCSSCSSPINIFIGLFNLCRCCPSTAATSPSPSTSASRCRGQRPALLRRRHQAAAARPTPWSCVLVMLVASPTTYLDIVDPLEAQ